MRERKIGLWTMQVVSWTICKIRSIRALPKKNLQLLVDVSPWSSTPSERAHTQNPQSSIAITTPVHPSPARHKQRALQPGRIGRALPWRPFVHTYNSTTPPPSSFFFFFFSSPGNPFQISAPPPTRSRGWFWVHCKTKRLRLKQRVKGKDTVIKVNCLMGIVSFSLDKMVELQFLLSHHLVAHGDTKTVSSYKKVLRGKSRISQRSPSRCLFGARKYTWWLLHPVTH